MKGKEKCKFLREIRKNIAEVNVIAYEPRECNFEGECSGTCPFCEKEATDLLAALKEKESKGEEIKIDEFSTLLLEKGTMEFDNSYNALVTEIEKVKEMMEPVGRIRCDDKDIERLKKEEEEIERIHREQMTPTMGIIRDVEHEWYKRQREEEVLLEEERIRMSKENSFYKKKIYPLIARLKRSGDTLTGEIDDKKCHFK